LKITNGAPGFVGKTLLLGALFYGVLLIGSTLFSLFFPWRVWQDPRYRLLYEPVGSDAQIILLGDSVWISSYVGSEDQTIWKTLERLTGKRVFNATLNGADPPDFLNAIRLLPARHGGGSVVFLDVTATRLLPRTFKEPVEGNYADTFSQMVADNPVNSVLVFLRRPLLLLDTRVVMNCILRARHFSVGDERYRMWARDGDYAAKRFRTFERYIIDTDTLRSVDWILILRSRLAAKGYRLITVVTPVNGFLIKAYADSARAKVYQMRVDAARESLLSFLRINAVEYVDCGDLDSESFADLIHTNARGDKRMAEKMAAFLATSENGMGRAVQPSGATMAR
jgi:hypothetical protein